MNVITEDRKQAVKDKLYSDSGTIYSLIVLYAVNWFFEWQWDIGFSTLSIPNQALVVSFVLAYLFAAEVYGAEKVVKMIFNPKWKARLLLEPDHKGVFDVLVGTEEAMDEGTEVEGEEDLHEKPAGPNGTASVEIARKQWRDDQGILHALPTWRALKDPLEIEESEANIYYNSKMIENELDEARAYKKEALVYKHQTSKDLAETVNRRIDESEKMDDETSYDALMGLSHAKYDPSNDDLDAQGVKEKFEEEEQEDDQDEEESGNSDESSEDNDE